MCRATVLMHLGLLTILLHDSNQKPPKPKRSPLEIGYVQFTVGSHHPHHSIHPDLTIHVPAAVSHVQHNLTNLMQHNLKHHVLVPHSNDHWVPGHVVNHAFIPGHIQHVIVPEHALLLTHAVHEVHAVLLHPVAVHPEVSVYRKHFGGYGVGVEYGGHGAGHGFQVA